MLKIMGIDFHQTRKQLKRSFFTHYSKQGVNSSFVHSLCNYNITFQKLETPMIKMRPVPAYYTSGRGALKSLGLGHCTNTLSLLPPLSRSHGNHTVKSGNDKLPSTPVNPSKKGKQENLDVIIFLFSIHSTNCQNWYLQIQHRNKRKILQTFMPSQKTT